MPDGHLYLYQVYTVCGSAVEDQRLIVKPRIEISPVSIKVLSFGSRLLQDYSGNLQQASHGMHLTHADNSGLVNLFPLDFRTGICKSAP